MILDYVGEPSVITRVLIRGRNRYRVREIQDKSRGQRLE